MRHCWFPRTLKKLSVASSATQFWNMSKMSFSLLQTRPNKKKSIIHLCKLSVTNGWQIQNRHLLCPVITLPYPPDSVLDCMTRTPASVHYPLVLKIFLNTSKVGQGFNSQSNRTTFLLSLDFMVFTIWEWRKHSHVTQTSFPKTDLNLGMVVTTLPLRLKHLFPRGRRVCRHTWPAEKFGQGDRQGGMQTPLASTDLNRQAKYNLC